MTLQEALSAIKTAVYGEDVREAILSGLGLCYSERSSGGYNPNADLNTFVNGMALFSSSAENKPFDSSFLLIAGGDEDECCQVAIDPEGTYSRMIRHKENDIWTEWVSVVETAMHLVYYYSYDGAEPPLHTERVSDGYNATWNGTPERASSDQYNYIFLGWNLLPNQTEVSEGALIGVTSSMNVYAAYRATPRSYTVYFYNGNELFGTPQSVVYGSNAISPSTDPTKDPSPQYNYSFIGWSTDPNATSVDADALNNITRDRNVYAVYSSSVRSYTVTFKNGNTELQTVTVPYGGTAVYNQATPTKEPDEQYTYAFVGWSTVDGATAAEEGATRNIDSDRVLYAAFSTTAVVYTVRFMNGAEVLETISVEYGHDASYSGDDPTKDPSAQYTYSFLGWNTDPNAAVADASALRNITAPRDIYAIYEQTIRSYTVTFRNNDTDPELGHVSVSYGGTATYTGDTPTKASSAQYNYTFAGWNMSPNQEVVDASALSNITGDRTVYTVFTASVRTYTVRFIDNGTILETKYVPYGNNVEYTGDEPEREDTEQYNYTFVGWNSSPNQTVKDDTVLQNITADRDIYAAYTMVVQTYVVSFCKDSIIRRGVVQGTCNYSAQIDLYPCETGIEGGISGWSSYLQYGKTYQVQFSTNNSNITLYIEDSNGAQTYNGNGTFYVEEGDMWSLWVRLARNTTYDNASFTISMTDGESDTNLLPLFAQFPTDLAPQDVSVRWGPEVYDEQMVTYDNNVTYAGTTPTKASTSEYRYVFVGWSEYENQSVADPNALLNIRRNKTLYPAFAETSNTVTVTFYYNSRVLETQTVAPGTTVIYGGETPTKQSVAQYNYEFDGWSELEDQTSGTPGILENVITDLDLYPAFRPVLKTFTVRFMNGSTVLQTSQVEYGSDAVYSGQQPSKESEQYVYTFVGWALQDGQTEADISALMDITAPRDIYAAYTSSTRYYTVSFYNGSTLLTTAQTTYNGSVTYTGSAPTKEPSGEQTYVFEGWALQDEQTTADPNALINVTADRNVYAAFSETVTYIFGIKREYGARDPAWVRTDDSVNLTATATYGSTAGHSDFDSLPIYKDISRITLSTGDVMVKIPKFYFQRYLETENGTQYEHIRISDTERTGFSVHPAFLHNGEEQEYVYVGAYLSSVTNSEIFSKTGQIPYDIVTGATDSEKTVSYCRTLAQNKGAGWGLYDISTHMAIQMLYLVEFANNNSQVVVGKGKTLVSLNIGLLLTGGCDNIANLTGGPENDNYDKQVVYRGIEDLWGNGLMFVDGVQSRSKVCICNNQNNYTIGASNDYTELSYTTATENYSVTKMGLDPNHPAYMFSIENNGTVSRANGYCDRQQLFPAGYANSMVCAGGIYNSDARVEDPGMFYFVVQSSSAEKVGISYVVPRLLRVPS